jgi:hypothetical protein
MSTQTQIPTPNGAILNSFMRRGSVPRRTTQFFDEMSFSSPSNSPSTMCSWSPTPLDGNPPKTPQPSSPLNIEVTIDRLMHIVTKLEHTSTIDPGDLCLINTKVTSIELQLQHLTQREPGVSKADFERWSANIGCELQEYHLNLQLALADQLKLAISDIREELSSSLRGTHQVAPPSNPGPTESLASSHDVIMPLEDPNSTGTTGRATNLLLQPNEGLPNNVTTRRQKKTKKRTIVRRSTDPGLLHNDPPDQSTDANRALHDDLSNKVNTLCHAKNEVQSRVATNRGAGDASLVRSDVEVATKNNVNCSPPYSPAITHRRDSTSDLSMRDLKYPITLIGDSHARALRVNSNPESKTWTFPGITVQALLNKLPEILSNTHQDTAFILAIGSNNIQSEHPNRITFFMEEMINLIRGTRPLARISFIGLFPRVTGSAKAEDKCVIHVNMLLRRLCVDNGCNFISMDKKIYNDRTLLARDGAHLTHKGKCMLRDEILSILTASVSEN